MAEIVEKLSGIVQRITYHNPDNGYSVLKVQSYLNPGELVAVIVHQTRVFAGATMEFRGSWVHHPQFGRQFKATHAVEKKPASVGALEKYLGSGLIKGVGPKTARKIVRHFGENTMQIFEEDIEKLVEVHGIAKKKLVMISDAWREHRMIRDVMIFLQGHGISTLFAVKIYQKYGDNAVDIVSRDPYRLAIDFYGIGFFSADRVALSLGIAPDSEKRIIAGIRHVLSASREEGHCYLTQQQITAGITALLEIQLDAEIAAILEEMEEKKYLCVRELVHDGELVRCYYAKSLYYDERITAEKIARSNRGCTADVAECRRRISAYCNKHNLALSKEQGDAVLRVVQLPFSILTGGPGCGKTTTTQVIVHLLESSGKRVLLAAPTGRAAQRMGEVIGREAMTIHRLLAWKNGNFTHNEERPLDGDFLIVDECSMLDITLTAALLKAVPPHCQVLFIGDADQLPSVGAGNVLRDIIQSGVIPCFRLTQIFRQARESLIIRYAHEINSGEIPRIQSPFKNPQIWQQGDDCIFLDSDEATKEQLRFIARVKKSTNISAKALEDSAALSPFYLGTTEPVGNPYEQDFVIPEKFAHVDIEKLAQAQSGTEELMTVLKKVHPWSTLHYGLSAIDSVVNLYLRWIPKYYGKETEIQILSPMTRGSLGTVNLNKVIQKAYNPAAEKKAELSLGDRVFREGDRVIHRRNNYDLEVFNGDIGRIINIDSVNLRLTVAFYPDGREVRYQRDDIVELDLAYAITIHKSQGSEFPVVIIPVLTQHFKMLYRNLLYTGLTRAKRLAVFVGTRKALAMAVRQQDSAKRQTALEHLLSVYSGAG